MTESLPQAIPADALRLLGQLTTAMAGGDRQGAVEFFRALLVTLGQAS
jgi:hypothetical protein